MTAVDCNPESSFSLAITLRSNRGRYSYPKIDPLYHFSISSNGK